MPLCVLSIFENNEKADLTQAKQNEMTRLQPCWWRPLAGDEMPEEPYRVHVPAQVDVKAILRRTGLTQAGFAASSGLSLHALRNWEQGKR